MTWLIPIDWYTLRVPGTLACEGYWLYWLAVTVARSPRAACFHNDSCTYWARSQSSGIPHFHAVHWMMSYTQMLWMRVKRKAAYLPGC